MLIKTLSKNAYGFLPGRRDRRGSRSLHDGTKGDLYVIERAAVIKAKFTMRLFSMILLLVASIMAVLGGCSPAFGSVAGTEIAISLEEISTPDKEIHLGQSMDRQFKIVSLEDECYVRLRFVVGETDDAALFDYLSPTEDGWIKADDGWWYFMTPLVGNGSAVFSSSMKICSDLDVRQRSSGLIELSEVTTAQAVDAGSFDPKWDAPEPWGDVEPDDSISSDSTQGIDGDDGSHYLVANRDFRQLRGLALTGDAVDRVLVFVVGLTVLLSFILILMRKKQNDPCVLTGVTLEPMDKPDDESAGIRGKCGKNA